MEKGRGAIYWSEDERRGPSPLELIRRAIHTYPDIFQSAILKLEKFDKGSLSKIVNRVPADWITPSSRTFAVALMNYNYEQLRRLI